MLCGCTCRWLVRVKRTVFTVLLLLCIVLFGFMFYWVHFRVGIQNGVLNNFNLNNGGLSLGLDSVDGPRELKRSKLPNLYRQVSLPNDRIVSTHGVDLLAFEEHVAAVSNEETHLIVTRDEQTTAVSWEKMKDALMPKHKMLIVKEEIDSIVSKEIHNTGLLEERKTGEHNIGLLEERKIGEHNTGLLEERKIGKHNTGLLEERKVGEHNTGLLEERKVGEYNTGLLEERKVGEHNTGLLEERKVGEYNTGLLEERKVGEHNTGLLEERKVGERTSLGTTEAPLRHSLNIRQRPSSPVFAVGNPQSHDTTELSTDSRYRTNPGKDFIQQNSFNRPLFLYLRNSSMMYRYRRKKERNFHPIQYRHWYHWERKVARRWCTSKTCLLLSDHSSNGSVNLDYYDQIKCFTSAIQLLQKSNLLGSESKQCKCRLYAEGESRVVGLVSLPGSGNTWIRGVLEQVTGICTGSMWCDANLRATQFCAEGVRGSRTLIVKNHDSDIRWRGQPLPPKKNNSKEVISDNTKPEFDAVIFIHRNPYDAIIAEHHRAVARSIWNHQFWSENFTNISSNDHVLFFGKEYFGNPSSNRIMSDDI